MNNLGSLTTKPFNGTHVPSDPNLLYLGQSVDPSRYSDQSPLGNLLRLRSVCSAKLSFGRAVWLSF